MSIGNGAQKPAKIKCNCYEGIYVRNITPLFENTFHIDENPFQKRRIYGVVE